LEEEDEAGEEFVEVGIGAVLDSFLDFDELDFGEVMEAAELEEGDLVFLALEEEDLGLLGFFSSPFFKPIPVSSITPPK